jgi:site-specific DNA recombinase
MNNRNAKSSGSQPEPRRCAVYTRKSTSMGLEQEFNSLDAQREACEQYISNRAHDGWQLVSEPYDDGGFTGANIARPAFQKLLDHIDAGKVDVVVVYKVDRLSRSLLDFAKVMDHFSQKGVALVSITQNFSTADAMGRLTLNMLMSFAEFEREMIAERTRDKIAAARRKGKWTGGQVPLGYDVEDKKLVVNEVEAPLVEQIFELYERYQSALAVAKQLNALGHLTKQATSKNSKNCGGKPWNKNAVLRVLKNGVYAGFMPYGDELHDGEHVAIIDKNRFNRIGESLEQNQKCGRRYGNNPDYLLRGILRCGTCECAMTPSSTRKKGMVYRYYRCINRDKRNNKQCDTASIPAGAIEDFVVERIRNASIDGALARQVAESLKARVETKRNQLNDDRAKLPRRIAKLSDEARQLVDKLANTDGATAILVEDRINQVSEALNQAESRLQQVEKAIHELAGVELEGKWLAESTANFNVVWEAMTPMNRVRLITILVKSVVIDEKTDTVTVEMTDLLNADGINDTENGDVPTVNQHRGAAMEATV